MTHKLNKAKLALIALGLVGFTACNTISGIGKDVQAAGSGIERGADNVKEEIKD